MSLASLQPHISSLLKSLPPHPIEQSKLNELIKDTLKHSKIKTQPESSKTQWEYLLKNEVFLLAVGSHYTQATTG